MASALSPDCVDCVSVYLSMCRSWQSKHICVSPTTMSHTLTFTVCPEAWLPCCSSRLPVWQLTGTLCVAHQWTVVLSMSSSSRHLCSFHSGSTNRCWLFPACHPWLADLQIDRSSSKQNLALVFAVLASSCQIICRGFYPYTLWAQLAPREK